MFNPKDLQNKESEAKAAAKTADADAAANRRALENEGNWLAKKRFTVVVLFLFVI
jgi:glutathione S-transferase